MAKKCKQPEISGDTARSIERRAMELKKSGVKLSTALTKAATEILGCKPRRAISGEGSLSYFRSIGRFHWDNQ